TSFCNMPEPWLRGPIERVHPAIAPALFAFQQAREDLAAHTEGLDAGRMWARPFGLAPVGFHLRHIAGSVDRLATYLAGGELSEGQLAALGAEMAPGASREELLDAVGVALDAAEVLLRRIDPARLGEERRVGRQKLPTTVIGLVVHLAEHTQRHVGQAISAAKLARAAPR
ncbi:MAG: DinB family protein, partial [Bryobacteraceae bacterium]